MAISFNDIIAFTANPSTEKSDKDRRDAEKKVVTGGGAVAATATAARAKAAKSGFDMFESASKVSKGMKGVTTTAKVTNTVTKQSKGLWSKVAGNAKWAKNAIMNWGSKFKNMKFIKPLVNSKLFMKFAGFLGYGFGVVTLIAGMSDIVKVTSDAVEKNVLHKDDDD